jgi:ketosteroid isomerase-like protein
VAEKAIEIFNREFASGASGVSDEARALYAPEPLIVPFRAALEGTEYSGPNALDQFVAETRESWEWVRVESYEVRELDAGRAIAAGTLVGRGRETGAEASSPIALLAVVRDGRLAEARTFLSEQDALAAVNA